MLIKSTFSLSVSQPTTIPKTYGIELIKILHKQMNLEMANDPIPNLTYSGIIGPSQTSSDTSTNTSTNTSTTLSARLSARLSTRFITFLPEQNYTLSLSGLDTNASQSIINLDLGQNLEFLGANFQIVDRQNQITTYEQLYTNLVAQDPDPIRRWHLQFITPTAFAQNQINLPLPVPSLMLRSWLIKWNNFAPVFLGSDELISYLENTITISYHQIKTKIYYLKNGYSIGFTGRVNLQILTQADSLLAHVANLLINYAQFAGTGMKTRLGMGQTLLPVVTQKSSSNQAETDCFNQGSKCQSKNY